MEARLSRLVGESVALGLILDGHPIDAIEAHRLGLVHRVVDPGAALAEACRGRGSSCPTRPARCTGEVRRRR